MIDRNTNAWKKCYIYALEKMVLTVKRINPPNVNFEELRHLTRLNADVLRAMEMMK